MELYVDGDEAAFDELYEAIRPALVSTLKRLQKTDDRVADALQRTLLRLHASRHRYRRGHPVLPWVLTIARHVALDDLRARAQRDVPLSAEDAARIPASVPEAEATGAEAEIILAVNEALKQLPEGTREVVRQHKLEGRAMSEIAEALGLKEGAVRVRAHRGYKSLAKLLVGFKTRTG